MAFPHTNYPCNYIDFLHFQQIRLLFPTMHVIFLYLIDFINSYIEKNKLSEKWMWIAARHFRKLYDPLLLCSLIVLITLTWTGLPRQELKQVLIYNNDCPVFSQQIQRCHWDIYMSSKLAFPIICGSRFISRG